MFATRGNCTVSLSVVTVPARYLRHFDICFLDFVLFLCFVSVLLSFKIVRFSHFGFPVLGRVRSQDLFSILILVLYTRLLSL